MIFVFGNGLSIGFDSRLTTTAITERVTASLGSTDIGVLRELTQLGSPEDPDSIPLEVDRGGFEQIAGPVDRLAEALGAVQRLFAGSSTIPLLADLRKAADGLRQHYVRIVGTVLREIDACCVVAAADAQRQASWQAMNEFAAELVKLRATMFTLNYDSLLMSALLEQGQYVYDGFRFGTLNVPLDRWSEPTTLYQMHGSVAWRWGADGLVHKSGLQAVRAEKLLDAWAAGDTEHGVPAVILTDLKTHYTEQYPFSTFYDELHHALLNESRVVVGGYSFGDRPLNRALARFLSRKTDNQLLIWNPSGTPDLYLNRLRKQLTATESAIGDQQIIVEHVSLPDADAVRRLP
ncbi:MAG: SIR2 family protein [Streptosporangiaceae bacterium]